MVVAAFPPLVAWLPLSATAVSAVRIRYADGHGLLRDILREAVEHRFTIEDVATETAARAGARTGGRRATGS